MDRQSLPSRRIVFSGRGKQILALLGVGLFLATQPGAGCLSDSNSGGTNNGDSRSPANEIPRRAAIAAEGRGDLNWVADADGQIYVQDLRDESLIVQHRIHRGDRVRVTMDDNRIRLNDDTIFHGDITSDHVHRIYIDRDRRFDNNDRGDNNSNRGDNADAIPNGSDLMGRGQNRELTFVAQRDGRAFVFDDDARRVIDSAPVSRGQRFTFSPGRHRATVDGQAVIDDRNIDSGRNYSVYFARD